MPPVTASERSFLEFVHFGGLLQLKAPPIAAVAGH